MKFLTNYLLILILSSSILMSSCSFSKYYYQTGDNDTAIGVAANHLRKNDKNWREALVLEKAYKEVTQKDMARIQFLKKEGNPDCWMEIYDLYSAINRRQNLVRPLLPLFIKKEYRNADIQLIDVETELIESKRKAAEYLYAHASQLMKNNRKADYRKAYQEFNELKTYFSSYKDADLLQQNCLQKGQNHIVLLYKNNTNLIIPTDFDKTIRDIQVEQYNTLWVKYHKAEDWKGSDEDYRITIQLQQIQISPEQVREREYTDEKTIEDGWTYALDSKGNVKKDSLGNDIKIKKYVTVRCIVRETQQNKQGAMMGQIEFSKRNTNSFQLLDQVPFNENLIFTNLFVTTQGD